jgi:hypothetical protein
MSSRVDHRHHALSCAVIEQVYAILGDPHRCADGAGGLELDNTSIDRRPLLSSRAAQRRDGSAYRRRGSSDTSSSPFRLGLGAL